MLQFMAYAAYRSRLETAFLADELAAALATIPQHSRAAPSLPSSPPKPRPHSPQPQSPRALPSPRARNLQEASGVWLLAGWYCCGACKQYVQHQIL